MPQQNTVVANPLLSALDRLGAGVRRKAARPKFGEIRIKPDYSCYVRNRGEIDTARSLDRKRFPEDEHYCLRDTRAPYRSPEDELTLFLEQYMREASSTVSAQQLPLSF